MNTKPYLTVLETAEALTICKVAVYALIKRGELSAYRFGAATRIRKVDLEKFITNSKVKRLGRPLKQFNTEESQEEHVPNEIEPLHTQREQQQARWDRLAGVVVEKITRATQQGRLPLSKNDVKAALAREHGMQKADALRLLAFYEGKRWRFERRAKGPGNGYGVVNAILPLP